METKARVESHVTRHFLWGEDEDFNRREKTTCIGGSERRVIEIRIVVYAQFSTRNGHRVLVNQVWTEQELIFH